jgi:hypothetical protein
VRPFSSIMHACNTQSTAGSSTSVSFVLLLSNGEETTPSDCGGSVDVFMEAKVYLWPQRALPLPALPPARPPARLAAYVATAVRYDAFPGYVAAKGSKGSAKKKGKRTQKGHASLRSYIFIFRIIWVYLEMYAPNWSMVNYTSNHSVMSGTPVLSSGNTDKERTLYYTGHQQPRPIDNFYFRQHIVHCSAMRDDKGL